MISNLKLQRIQREITQIDLWMSTGIPQWRISLIERGIRPKPEEAEGISKALDVPVDEIWPAEEQTSSKEV